MDNESGFWAGQTVLVTGGGGFLGQHVLAKLKAVGCDKVVAPTTLHDLGIDELALADVVLGLETRFDIDIDDTEATAWQTVGDVVGLVARRMRESAT